MWFCGVRSGVHNISSANEKLEDETGSGRPPAVNSKNTNLLINQDFRFEASEENSNG